MLFIDAVNPFFEACEYLAKRFSTKRIADAIAELKPSNEIMHNNIWALYEQVAKIEQELDDAVEATDTLKYYFTPMETIEKRAEGSPLSLGSVLLSCFQLKPDEMSLDGLRQFYSTASQATVLARFHSQMLTSSLYGDIKETCSDMNGFMAYIDSVLVRPEEKWKVMDLAANPIKHLDMLYDTVTAITKLIESKSADYSDLIKMEKTDLDNGGSEMLFELFDIKPQSVSRVCVIPSLLSFSGAALICAEDSESPLHIYLGVYALKVLELRGSKENILVYINLIKALSDNTRFKALYEMQNKYSYGQELAEMLGSSRNAMYYHLEKLLSIGLIELKMTDYRMLYTMNKKAVYDKLTALRDFLVGGWTPGDDERQEDEPEEEKVQR